MHKPFRIVVIGAGEWAQLYHLPALKAIEQEASLSIIGIWNRTAERAKEAARLFGIGQVYRSLDEALDEKRADCYVILVRSSALFEIATKLLPRRLPLLTEKPPGKSYSEAHRLAELAVLPNVVAFNRRYMPINRRFKELADEIRGAYFAECQFYRNERSSDHFILETGIHGINYMEHLCGPIRSVRTEKPGGSPTRPSIWISSVTFDSGMRGIFKFFPSCGSSLERYELHGRDRSIYLHCPQTYTSDHPGRILIHEKGRQTASILDEEGERILTAGFLAEYRDLFKAIRYGSDTLSNFRNASNTMRVAEAIEAGDRDGTVYTLPPEKFGCE